MTWEALVGIYEVGYALDSSCADVTVPDTVAVSVPALGVNVSDTLSFAPVPTSGPAVDAPERVTVPVP